MNALKSSLPVSAEVRVPQTILPSSQSCCPHRSCFPASPLPLCHRNRENREVLKEELTPKHPETAPGCRK